MPKMSGYVKTFKVKDRDKDENNKLICFRINDKNLLEEHKPIWTKIEDLINIELSTLLVYGDRYIKTELITYRHKVYTNFCRLNVPQDDMECESFIVTSIDSLFVYAQKYYIQVYLDNCVYKTVN